jgi:decaprenylphospho-beta-D-erythro-pentofuranosid-2-ulose 2-reductase
VTAPGRTVLVLGGTSEIARGIAMAYAAAGWRIVLAGRNRAGCERNARDLVARYAASVQVAEFDVGEAERFEQMLAGLPEFPDSVVCVVGMLGDQVRAQADLALARDILRVNFEGPALILGLVAERMAARGRGTIVGVGSVAGDRGRASNYLYGAAKAGFAAFLSGLRNRLASRGVHVLTVKPGYVRTRMTDAMALPGPLTADPRDVGEAVYRAAELSRRNIIYVRPVWRLAMGIIGLIPESLFKRLRL